MLEESSSNSFIKTINDTDYTQTVQYVYLKLIDKYRNIARISDIFTLLREAFDINEWIALDPNLLQNGNLESYLIDEQIEWMNNRPVDFDDIYQALLKAGDFVGSEKKKFEQGNVRERLWAIFLVITKPELNLKYNS